MAIKLTGGAVLNHDDDSTNRDKIRLTAKTFYEPESKLYVSTCIELGISSQGDDYAHAYLMLLEAIELYLEEMPDKIEEISDYRNAQFREILCNIN